MILGKIWRTIQGQLNKLVDFFWAADPVAIMQEEYDRAVQTCVKAVSVWPTTGHSSRRGPPR